MGTAPAQQIIERPASYWSQIDNRSPAERRAENVNRIANIMAERFAQEAVARSFPPNEPFWEKVKFLGLVILFSLAFTSIILAGIAGGVYLTIKISEISLLILRNLT